MPAKILAINVGVFWVKAAVLDVASLAPIGQTAVVSTELDRRLPSAEIPAERLWSHVAAAAQKAASFQDGIEGIGLSCFTGGPILLDSADRPLLPIWLPHDSRSRSAARQVWADVGNEFLHTSGSRPLPGKISAVVFRQQHHEDNYLTHRTRSYFDLNGWLAFRLTREKFTDPAGACASGVFGTLTDRQWSPRWCEYFEIKQEWLPPVASADTTVGYLQPAVAAELGVPSGVPVKLGTDDIGTAALAAGMRSGDLLDIGGAGADLLVALADKPASDLERRTRLLGVDDTFLYVSDDPAGPRALEWIRGVAFQDQSLEQFTRQTIATAMNRRTPVTLEPANLCGDDLEIELHRASLRNLTIATDRIDLLAAVLNSVRDQHLRARANVGIREKSGRLFFADDTLQDFRIHLPGYAQSDVVDLQDAALRGIARLFAAIG
jgi:sugar (pentulose or hexulose) kinase